jgi:hypothetical protein
MLSDLRSAFRQLLRSPAYSAPAILTLASAIAFNVAILGLIFELTFAGSPVDHIERFVRINTVFEEPPRRVAALSLPDYREVAQRATALDGVVASHSGEAGLSTRHGAERITIQLVSPTYFEVLGVSPHSGRLLGTEDEPAAVVSHSLARRLFGDRLAPYEPIRINSLAVPVVGVSERHFKGLGVLVDPDIVFLPLAFHELFLPKPRVEGFAPGSGLVLTVVGRLSPASGLESAAAEIAVIGKQLAETSPHPTGDRGLSATPLADSVGGLRAVDSAGMLAWLAAVAGTVLLIAGVNVSGLLLARGISRQRELFIRSSLGAGRWPLLRLLLAECFALSTCGVGLGLLLGLIGRELLWRLRPVLLPEDALERRFDETILAPALAILLLATLVIGSLPALRLSRGTTSRVLSTHGTGSRGSRIAVSGDGGRDYCASPWRRVDLRRTRLLWHGDGRAGRNRRRVGGSKRSARRPKFGDARVLRHHGDPASRRPGLLAERSRRRAARGRRRRVAGGEVVD